MWIISSKGVVLAHFRMSKIIGDQCPGLGNHYRLMQPHTVYQDIVHNQDERNNNARANGLIFWSR